VQGNRTCGVNHRPSAAFLNRLADVCGFEPPREHGLGTVATIEAMHRGDVKVFVALGGNFALCTPDLSYGSEALRNCELTVQVSTKLNRSHVVHGKRALILPCLARTDKDHQASGLQGVTVEDSMSMVHMSYGMKEPGSPHQRSECAIIAGLAQATLPDSTMPWKDYVDNYDRIRDTMSACWTASRTSTPAPAVRTGSGSRSRHGTVCFRLRQAARNSRSQSFRTTCIQAPDV
jgi:anaerobic selenocysteine-containing dehydrogenase